jgi:hypothetical protein
VEHLKRVLMEKCPPKNIKEKIRYKRTMEEVWKYLDNAFVRPNTFLHDLMQPVNTIRAVPEKDWEALEACTPGSTAACIFKHARESCMKPVALHVINLKKMYWK